MDRAIAGFWILQSWGIPGLHSLSGPWCMDHGIPGHAMVTLGVLYSMGDLSRQGH